MGSGGTNDVIILGGILFILLGLGVFMPMLQEIIGFSQSINPQPATLPSNPYTDAEDYTAIAEGTWSNTDMGILESLGRALFWVYDWGDASTIIALIFNTLHIFIRIIAGVIIYRLIRSGAG